MRQWNDAIFMFLHLYCVLLISCIGIFAYCALNVLMVNSGFFVFVVIVCILAIGAVFVKKKFLDEKLVRRNQNRNWIEIEFCFFLLSMLFKNLPTNKHRGRCLLEVAAATTTMTTTVNDSVFATPTHISIEHACMKFIFSPDHD